MLLFAGIVKKKKAVSWVGGCSNRSGGEGDFATLHGGGATLPSFLRLLNRRNRQEGTLAILRLEQEANERDSVLLGT